MENDVLFFNFTPSVRVIEDLSLLFFNIVAPPKQTKSQRSKTHCLYNKDIKSRAYQLADNDHH